MENQTDVIYFLTSANPMQTRERRRVFNKMMPVERMQRCC